MIHGLVIEGAQAGLVVVRSLPLVVVVSRLWSDLERKLTTE